MGEHPANAAYVSADGLVSFDRFGRKIDSLGNVAWGDYQSAGDAGASPIERPDPQQDQQRIAAQRAAAQAAGVQGAKNQWQERNGVGARMTRRSSWDNSLLPDSPPQPSGQLAAGQMGPRPRGQMVESPWPATTRWESGSNLHPEWRAQRPQGPQGPQGAPPMPQQTQSYVPPTLDPVQPERDAPMGPRMIQSYVPPPPMGNMRDWQAYVPQSSPYFGQNYPPQYPPAQTQNYVPPRQIPNYAPSTIDERSRDWQAYIP